MPPKGPIFSFPHAHFSALNLNLPVSVALVMRERLFCVKEELDRLMQWIRDQRSPVNSLFPHLGKKPEVNSEFCEMNVDCIHD